MPDYLYPTRVNHGDEWLTDMLNDWRGSKKHFVCFPWINNDVHTIEDQRFWLYMYYSYRASDIASLQGKIEFRLHIVDWGKAKFFREDTYLARENDIGIVWFLCDKYEKICKDDNNPITLQNFVHKYNKRLVSTIRDSIPPVLCKTEIKILNSYQVQN